MKQNESKRGTFVVRITHTENATWQGTVTWADGDRTVPFRSMLELIRLIDGAVEQENMGPGPEEDNDR